MEKIKKILSEYSPYLEDIRKHLYRSTIIFLVLFISGFLLAGKILKYALSFIRLDSITIATSSPFEFADIAMNIGFSLASIIIIPYLFYGLYSFISPALTTQEKRKLFLSIPIGIGLFLLGFFYVFFVLYYVLELIASINTNLGIENIWNIGKFLSEIFFTAALAGLVFEFPIFITILVKLRLIDTVFLKNKRRLIYFIIFCVVSLLPPTDGFSLIAMSLPLVVLYEVTILINNK